MADRIDALKTLLTRLIDSRESYREAIAHVESDQLRTIFEEFMARRDRNAAAIRVYLVTEGHVVPEDGSMLASSDRMFAALRDVAASSGDAETLSEMVRSEKTLLDAYVEGIEGAGDGEPEFYLLEEQYRTLKSAIAQLETRRDIAA